MARELQGFGPAVLQMRAVILAAGMGRRLGAGYRGLPKCLLEFGGKSLLRRHIEILKQFGVEEIVVGVGYEARRVEEELAAIGVGGDVEIQYNPHYEKGSVVTLWNLRESLCRGGDVLLMDADMLFDHRLLDRLLGSPHRNCLLLDRNLEVDEEPVKLCIRGGVAVELRKQVGASDNYDYCGEMAGLVGLSGDGARQLVSIAQGYVRGGDTEQDYEEVLRDMLLSESGNLGFEDCTGLPWIEIDFANDVDRARKEVLPQLRDSDAAGNVAQPSWSR